jgi:hypothetical protein
MQVPDVQLHSFFSIFLGAVQIFNSAAWRSPHAKAHWRLVTAILVGVSIGVFWRGALAARGLVG